MLYDNFESSKTINLLYSKFRLCQINIYIYILSHRPFKSRFCLKENPTQCYITSSIPRLRTRFDHKRTDEIVLSKIYSATVKTQRLLTT